jgi:hypothetical protein
MHLETTEFVIFQVLTAANIEMTGIYLLDFIHRHCVSFSKPLRFEGWFFFRPQVKPTLLDPLDRASL